MRPIEYDHAANQHSLAGPRRALPMLLGDRPVRSLLDVGCGHGTWLRAAHDLGIDDICGIDGVDVPREALLFPPEKFQRLDLTQAWSLGRKFDVALCLEVAEHLEVAAGRSLVNALAAHADWVIFSAACPGQPGQHHVHCAWPAAWQELFNAAGFACDDAVRWKIWADAAIEPWYRQNVFTARRSSTAGTEPRLAAVVHPDLLPAFSSQRPVPANVIDETRAQHLTQIEDGAMPTTWYLGLPLSALLRKMRRRFVGSSRG